MKKILLSILDRYYNSEDLDALIRGYIQKERVGVVGNIDIVIYTNDHNPPHFHVKTKDGTIDAKFKIEDGSFISGSIGSNDLKKINAFYNSPKTQVAMKLIWDKRYK